MGENEGMEPLLSDRTMKRLLRGVLWFNVLLSAWILLGAFGVFR